MSSTTTLENAALREKLLHLLRKGIPEEIVNDIERIIYQSDKASNIADCSTFYS